MEDLGYKNPLTKKVSLNKERILYWLSKGAKPSATIHNLLVAEKVIEGKKINVTKKSKKPAQSPAGIVAGASAEAKPETAVPGTEPEKPAEPTEAPTEQPPAA